MLDFAFKIHRDIGFSFKYAIVNDSKTKLPPYTKLNDGDKVTGALRFTDEKNNAIKFTSKNPYKFIITGRTKSFINAFGEELIVDNAEKGLAYACQKTNAEVLEYTAAPVFMDGKAKCRHQWLIEFSRPPKDIDTFASILDSKLQEINSDYEAKRYKDITLQHLEIITARKDLFNDWLKSKGKLGGQHKVPRLNNSRDIIEQMIVMNSFKKD